MSDKDGGFGGDDLDRRVRLAAFAFLAEQVALRGDALPRKLLAARFSFEGERVPLLGPQGIFKPRLLDLPLSITTVPVVEGREKVASFPGSTCRCGRSSSNTTIRPL